MVISTGSSCQDFVFPWGWGAGGGGAKTLSGKEGHPEFTGSLELDKELVMALSEPWTRKSDACRVRGLRQWRRRHLRVKANTTQGPGEKMKTHQGSATGSGQVRDQGKEHPPFLGTGSHLAFSPLPSTKGPLGGSEAWGSFNS